MPPKSVASEGVWVAACLEHRRMHVHCLFTAGKAPLWNMHDHAAVNNPMLNSEPLAKKTSEEWPFQRQLSASNNADVWQCGAERAKATHLRPKCCTRGCR